ncbi:hypothetical protein AB205_0058560 [Aquarana catesbeiana]|uniref:Transmembrane protein 14C n=1 Tax=Aquarana catesbeiana TaxID=8400 RepID=A0A2G9RYP6_AQUCT|nr:hypothetical protein AB205_0058560 [Aquarana catesbeiana]
MAVDWIGFAYAVLLASGGFLGFSRKGSIVSLAAGLTFGLLAAYGAFRVSYDPRDIKISLIAAGSLSVIMGLRYNRSRKVMPAGIHFHGGEAVVEPDLRDGHLLKKRYQQPAPCDVQTRRPSTLYCNMTYALTF